MVVVLLVLILLMPCQSILTLETAGQEPLDFSCTLVQLWFLERKVFVKVLRLAYRLGQTLHNVVAAHVLYRLGLAEQLRGRNGGYVAGFDRAMTEHLDS
jgi:hypothetical protein